MTETGLSPARRAQFDALFDPKGVIVAGASTHPGKFGFVALHNILANGYKGNVFATNPQAPEILGVQTMASIEEVPDGGADMVFVCTPAKALPSVLRSCAGRGVKAAFVASGGFGELGAEGQAAEDELVALGDELGILVAGPNGQGVVSTPSSLCAQIVAPYPVTGSIGIASQSGNFISSFSNWANLYGVGVSRAVSAGNAAATSIADYLTYFADDPHTSVALCYLESLPEGDGRSFYEALRRVSEQKPVVLVKGGASAAGARAAASHTGALATDDVVFDGMCRQAGVVRCLTLEEAFEAAATFATQPLPTGPRVMVCSTAGGWGVATADALSRSSLELAPMPDDLIEGIDTLVPPRWSRNNPIDLAGGETRDTIPQMLEMVAANAGVDAVVYLGLGIQANQAKMTREGPFYPDHGLDRIVDYHERQDARFAAAAAAASEETSKPILTATELAIVDPSNAGPAAVRDTGRLCYSSANRAVSALEKLWTYASWRRRRGLD